MAFFKKLFVYFFCRLTLKKNIKGATNRHSTSTIKYIQGGSLALTDEMCHLRYIYEANSITCNAC